MQFVHEKAEAAVEALTADATDPEIADALADYLLAGERFPKRFDISHNARATKCLLVIDRPGLKWSSMLHTTAASARVWIFEALVLGYEVRTMTRRGVETLSIAARRRTIQHLQQMAEWRAKRDAGELPAVDDEIPF